MWNPYVIILGLFAAAGLAATLWGLTIIAKGRRTLRWPSTEGIIEESRLASEADDLFPHILFSYRVPKLTSANLGFRVGPTRRRNSLRVMSRSFP